MRRTSMTARSRRAVVEGALQFALGIAFDVVRHQVGHDHRPQEHQRRHQQRYGGLAAWHSGAGGRVGKRHGGWMREGRGDGDSIPVRSCARRTTVAAIVALVLPRLQWRHAHDPPMHTARPHPEHEPAAPPAMDTGRPAGRGAAVGGRGAAALSHARAPARVSPWRSGGARPRRPHARARRGRPDAGRARRAAAAQPRRRAARVRPGAGAAGPRGAPAFRAGRRLSLRLRPRAGRERDRAGAARARPRLGRGYAGAWRPSSRPSAACRCRVQTIESCSVPRDESVIMRAWP